MSERKNLEAAICALEAQRSALGASVVDAAVRPLLARLAEITEKQPEEQRKLVTVLFADVTGFTSLSQRMDPEEVAAAINKLWRRVDAAIESHGGTIDKHVGDAVMALFGAPVAREDDAERAVLAALALQEIVPEASREIGGRHEPAVLGMRVGLHTGTVHLGKVGSGKEYTAIGDTVNVASRLESAAPRGGVLISSDTHSHVRGRFDFGDRGLIEIRGRSEPMSAFEVKGRRARKRVAASKVGGLEVPLVGREHEIRRLKEHASSVAGGGGATMVTVLGEKGLGASRLLTAFASFLREAEDGAEPIEVRTGVGGPPTATYRILRDLLFSCFDLSILDDDTGMAAALERQLSSLPFYRARQDRLKESVVLLKHLIGPGSSKSEEPGEAAELRRRAFRAVAELLGALSHERGLLALFVEDLHSADTGSLDLLCELVSACSDLPLLLVCTARPGLLEKRPDWATRKSHFKMDLGPLCDEASGRLVDALLARAREVPASLRARLIAAAEGHPFYMEELVRHLIDRGAVDPGGPHWTVYPEKLGSLELPSTLTALVQARIDVLSPAERGALERAAVLGKDFWDEALFALGSGEGDVVVERDEISAGLDGLIRRGLVVEREASVFAGARELAFAQRTLHDVAYEMILLRRRPLFHRQAALWLVERAGEASALWAGRVAEHFEAAGDEEQAGRWFLRAADQAQRMYVLGEAVGLYGKVLEHPSRAETAASQRLSAMNGLFRALYGLGRHAEAEQVCREMCVEAASVGDGVAESTGWSYLSHIHSSRSELDEASEAAERAVMLARAADDAAALPAALRALAQCLDRAGRFREAIVPLEEALTLSSRPDLLVERGRALRLLAAVRRRLGMLEEAEESCREACDIFRALSHKGLLTASLISLGELKRARGDAGGALSNYEEALEIARALGFAGHELVALVNKGGALVALGRPEDAEAVLMEVTKRAPESWYGLSETWRFLAEARLPLGRTGEALEAAISSLEHAGRAGSPETLGGAWRVIAEIAGKEGSFVRVAGDDVDADLAFARSLELLEKAGAVTEAVSTLQSWSRHCFESDREWKGRELADQARARLDMLETKHSG